jgi:hypothetical protein
MRSSDIDLPPAALTADLLVWLAARPRTYGETLDAWRTSCPRLPVWEHARDAGLVEVGAAEGAGFAQAPVRLTPAGHAALVAAR